MRGEAGMGGGVCGGGAARGAASGAGKAVRPAPLFFSGC